MPFDKVGWKRVDRLGWNDYFSETLHVSSPIEWLGNGRRPGILKSLIEALV